MRLIGKVAVIVFALSLFASPLMACLLPDSALTAEERDCCRRMAGKCGEMPSSHSCCQRVFHSDPYISTARTVFSGPSDFVVAPLSLAETVGMSEQISLFAALSDAHAPPESPPVKTSILRI